jgi:hypothetical protein
VPQPDNPKTEPRAEPEVSSWEGPDPRDWENRPVIWNLVRDIEALVRTQAALAGSSEIGAGPAYPEAQRFLQVMGDQLRGCLALAVLDAYGMAPGEPTRSSPFDGAGKPRAFGADLPQAASV